MVSDPNKPLIRLLPETQRDRAPGSSKYPPAIEPYSLSRQMASFAPKFNRLRQVLEKDPAGLELRTDPRALAPERLLVFEVRGSINNFAAAVRRVPGLEFVTEEELSEDSEDKAPLAYLMVPDARALQEIGSLWTRWQDGRLNRGETPWKDVFGLLKDLRPWGPTDRVQSSDIPFFLEDINQDNQQEPVKVEIELIFRSHDISAAAAEKFIHTEIYSRGGRILHRSRIKEIAYHSLLAELPRQYVEEIIERYPYGIAGLEPVMYVRPQSIVTKCEFGDGIADNSTFSRRELQEPILAILDGVPAAGHPALQDHLTVEDQFNLVPETSVGDRTHGTAMASLVIRGDLNNPTTSLPRRVHFVPVLGARERFPDDRLVVDVIYEAVKGMRGDNPSASGVLIINMSLGNKRRIFQGQLSAWARLLDRLAYDYGLLFIVSSGNHEVPFGIPAFAQSSHFEDAQANDRSSETIRALHAIMADRRLLSPGETVNGITVGAYNHDAVSLGDRLRKASRLVDPYPNLEFANPSSALGPGFASSVKPDILMPGSKEHLKVVRMHSHIHVEPVQGSRAAGLKVATPDIANNQTGVRFTSGSSAAAALASRTAHLIHDALEEVHGPNFTSLTTLQRAVLLKALLVHTAKWPEEAAATIKAAVGPFNSRQFVRQKDNIRRFLGYGVVRPDEAIACAGDRATFWAVGTLSRDKSAVISIPIPGSIGGLAKPHAMSATLAWFTPVSPGRKTYRSVRLKISDPEEIKQLGMATRSMQPDLNQTNRGTLFTRCWEGKKAPIVSENMSIDLLVQRDPDQGLPIDEDVPFGLAITISMPGVVEIYDEIRQRVATRSRP